MRFGRTFALSLLGFVAGQAPANEFALAPDSDVIGAVQIVRSVYEDTFISLARKYDVGPEELRHANPGVDFWLPGEGTEIVIPSRFVLPDAPRRGLVLNVPELRLYYFPDDDSGRVFTYPVGVGREGWTTPYGRTTVVRTRHLPTWYPPASVREEHAARGDILPAIVPPGPENPLGEHALYLGFSSYLIHGTNDPRGVGLRSSHGCIRLFPEDIESLFGMAGVGTEVTIVNHPYKFGWGDGGLYLEAHPPLVEESEEWNATELTRRFVAVTETRRVQVRWDQAEGVMAAGRGIPEFVSVDGTMITLAASDDEPVGAE